MFVSDVYLQHCFKIIILEENNTGIICTKTTTKQ